MAQTIHLICPKCQLPALAELDKDFKKFVIYTCPRCRSNVVCYENKMEVLSDRLVNRLLKSGRLEFCGEVSFHNFRSRRLRTDPISGDDVTNLRILLETESDSAKIISRL